MATIETTIICGEKTLTTTQVNVEQIRQVVDRNFSQPYRILFYDAQTMAFIDLNERLENNRTTILNEELSRRRVQLFIVRDQASTTLPPSTSNTACDRRRHSLRLDSKVLGSKRRRTNLAGQYSVNTSAQRPIERLSFTLDVKAEQKNIYRTDQFRIRPERSKGRIACVQGVKTPDQLMLRVLPRLRIPEAYRQQTPNRLRIVVAVVTEEIRNGTRIWFKNAHKQFLPSGYDRNTEALNPIHIDFSTRDLVNNELPLELRMVTKWNKNQDNREEFYRMDESQALQLHPAAHNSSFPRLCCVVEENEQCIWETLCLSDFIRPTRRRQTSSRSKSQRRRRV